MTELAHDRLRDEATVYRMAQTSWRSPRDVLTDCGHCGHPFWAHRHNARYCGTACYCAAHYHRRRDRIIARHAVYRAARRAQRVAA
jgi:hypothetical protein